MKYMKMKLADQKLNSSSGFMCETKRDQGRDIPAEFLVILADDRTDEWMFDVRSFWPACGPCVELLEHA